MVKNKGNGFNEIEYLKKFEPQETLLWLQIILCHPNNGLYIHRIEYLMGLFFSIAKEDFGTDKSSFETMKFLFERTESDYKKLFMPVEDFEGFDQCKLIPFFFERKKYFFFYGALERPYEHLKQVTETYFSESLSDDGTVSSFKNEFLESLNFQTELLTKMNELPENKIKQDIPYVPSQDYFEELRPYFFHEKDLHQEIPVLHELGFLSSDSPQAILDKCANTDLFKYQYVNVNEATLYLYPQIHLNIFINRGREILEKETEYCKRVFENYKERVSRVCLKLFTSPKHIFALLEKDTDKNLLDGVVDFATLVDTNKLFLFSAVEYDFNEDISQALNKKNRRALNIERKAIAK